MAVETSKLPESIKEIRAWSASEDVQSRYIDELIATTLNQEFPFPEYRFEPDRRRPRVIQASRWKSKPNYFGQDLWKRIGRPKDLDGKAIEAAGANWLNVVKPQLP